MRKQAQERACAHVAFVRAQSRKHVNPPSLVLYYTFHLYATHVYKKSFSYLVGTILVF